MAETFTPTDWRILLVEDSLVSFRLISKILTRVGASVDLARNLSEGRIKVENGGYDAILLDLGLPDSWGLQTFVNFHEHCKNIPLVVISATDDEQLATQAVQLGAQDYLLKGPQLVQGEPGHSLLVRSLRYAIERHRIQNELIQERNSLEARVHERTLELQSANDQLVVGLAERKRYEFMVNTTNDPIVLIDPQRRFRAVNDAYCRASNKLREQIVGSSWSQFWDEKDERNCFDAQIHQALNGVECQYEGEITFASAGKGYYEVAFIPFWDPEDRVNHVVIVYHDETARKQVEDQIRQQYFQLNGLHEINQAALTAESMEEIAQAVLMRVGQLLPSDQVSILLPATGSEGTICVTGDSKCKAESQVSLVEEDIFQADLMRGGRPYRVSLLDKNLPVGLGKLHLGQYETAWLVSPVMVEAKAFGLILFGSGNPEQFNERHVEIAQAICTQLALILRNRQLVTELSKINAHLRLLTASLVSTQEDERRRISLELHDEAGQFLTALQLSLSVVQNELEAANDPRLTKIQEASELANNIIGKIRTLAHDLRPPALDTVGLNQALDDYFNRISRQSGIGVHYTGDDCSSLPGYIQITLYRMAQEAFTNILKYARATQVFVTLQCDAEEVSFEISDNGVGFTHLGSMKPGAHSGIGLLGIHDRIEALGGSFTIETQPGHGTKLAARVPVRSEYDSDPDRR